MPYDPSDGVSADVGDVHVLQRRGHQRRRPERQPRRSRSSTRAATTSTSPCSTTSDGEKVDPRRSTCEAGTTGELGFGDDGQLFLADIDTDAGGLLPVYFQYGDEQGRQLSCRCSTATLEQYQRPAADPTPTPTPDADATTARDADARRPTPLASAG